MSSLPIVGSMFGAKSPPPLPPPPAPPAPPTRDLAADAVAEQQKKLRLGAGRSSTILTSGQGVSDNGEPVQKKTLLGA